MEEKTTDLSPRPALAQAPADAPWFAYYDAGVPHSLQYRAAALYTWLDEAADERPGALAFIFHNSRMTYARLRKEAEILAANLRKHGVRPGDRVGIMLPNLPQTIITFWGVLKAGAVVTMINPLYKEKELMHLVSDADIRHLVSVDLCWPKLEKLLDRLPIERYFITTVAEGLAFPLNWLQGIKAWREKSAVRVPYDAKRVFSFSVLRKGSERLSHPIDKPKEHLALLQYTGGTTGLPKGAMLTHYNVGANVQQIEAVLHFLKKTPQTFMAVLPFFHVYGLTTCLVFPVLIRATVVPAPRFVPQELLESMEKHKVTALPGAPAMYIALLQQKNTSRFALDSLRICISGSAPMPMEAFRQFEETYHARVIEGYGLSEASPITHLNPLMGLHKVGAIGLPLPDTEACIVDSELGIVPLAPGKIGELVVRGPQVMLGYWNQPDETAGALRNGWLYTGDIAVMDEEGFFTIVDRKKDMILVAGYNVSPREIDEVLFEHPKVKEAVSVGVPHPTRGEIIKAYVVLKDGDACDKSEIIAWCRDRLANYKVPRSVEFRSELPKTLVGKILRRALRAEEEAALRQHSGDAGPGADDDALPDEQASADTPEQAETRT